MPPKPPVNLPRVMRKLGVIEEKLDLAITGYGERLDKLESGHADHQTKISKLQQNMRWVFRKLGGGEP